jgi:hypothetical protein
MGSNAMHEAMQTELFVNTCLFFRVSKATVKLYHSAVLLHGCFPGNVNKLPQVITLPQCNLVSNCQFYSLPELPKPFFKPVLVILIPPFIRTLYCVMFVEIAVQIMFEPTLISYFLAKYLLTERSHPEVLCLHKK